MHDLTGKISGVSVSYTTGKPLVTFEMNEKENALSMANELSNLEKVSIKVDRFREKKVIER